MLVRSRSKACGVCHKRKVKCDKAIPSCLQCTNDGWECPGYKTAWKQKPHSRTYGGYPQYESQWILDSNEQDLSRLSQNSQRPTIVVNTQHVIRSPRSLPSSISFSLAQKLIGLLEEDMGNGVKIQSLGAFISYVPARIGHNKALDDATDCICSTYISTLQVNGRKSNLDRHKYLQALRSLRKCMLDGSELLSSNVLAAAVLLSWYEILAENLDNSWLAHIKGCAQLIQARGPSRHVAIFDKALLHAEAGHISAEALISCTSPFLNSPPWQEALRPHQDMTYQKDWYFQSLHAIGRRLAQVAAVVSNFKHLIESIRQNSYSMDDVRAALKSYETLRREIQDYSIRINLKACMGINQQRGYLLLAKQSLALLKLDAHLFDIFYLLGTTFRSDDLSPEEHLAIASSDDEYEHTLQSSGVDSPGAVANLSSPNPSLWAEVPFPNSVSQLRALAYLNSSISNSAILLKESVPLYMQFDRFGARRLTFMLRMVCREARKRGSVHQIWKETEEWLDILIRNN